MSFVDPGGTEPIKPPDDSGDWEWDIGGRELNVVWTKVEIVEEKTSKQSWVGSAAGFIWAWTKRIAGWHWTAGKKPYDWTREALGTIWDKSKSIAGNLWGWAQDHQWLAGGAALGIAVLSLAAGKHLWNWVLAPAIRTATNTALGYAIGGNVGAAIGFATGVVHGLAMAKAGSYDWKGVGWLQFLADNTYSLFNSGIGAVFATANLGWNNLDEAKSKDTGSLFYDQNWFGTYATTLGNVTVGQQVPDHESHHALQARLLGPAYIPLVLLNFEVNTILPWWLIWGKNKNGCGGSSFKEYFTGVYRNTWHEAWAYSVQGSTC
jgi:hypothetical protein